MFIVLTLWEVFLVNPSFVVYWTILSSIHLSSLLRIKIPKKVKFFTWQVLHGRVKTLDRLLRKLPSLVGLFCYNLCWKAKESWDNFFWRLILRDLYGVSSFKHSVSCSPAIGDISDMFREFLLHLLSCEKSRFL